MNILIKLMSIVSLVIAPSLAQIYVQGDANDIGVNTPTESTISQTPVSDAAAPAEDNEYSAFIAALEADGLFTDATTKISVVNDRIVIDDKTLDQAVSARYLPLLGGATNIEMEFK